MKTIPYDKKSKLVYTPVDTVERRKNLSYEEFVQDYASVGKPVIITDALRNWKASTKWTMDFFRSQYGAAEYLVIDYKADAGMRERHYSYMRVDDYIDYITSDTVDKSLYLSEFNAWNHPELQEDCEDLIYFKNWYRKIPIKFLNKYCGRISSVLIGRKGSTAGLHYDRRCDTAWVAVISGRKQVLLFSPDQEKYLYGGQVDPFNPNFEKFPLYAKAKPVECMLNPGEIIHMPPIWWHDIRNLEDTIGITNNTLNEWSYDLVYRQWVLKLTPVGGHIFPILVKFPWLCRLFC
ncbi:MAG: cupin-like domain-containing protein [Cyanobacteria bacterium J06635_15]